MRPTQHIFRLLLARPVTTALGDDPWLVHLAWTLRDGETTESYAVQLYVDDQLQDAFTDPAQREAWVQIDRRAPHRFEVLAVDPADIRTAMPDRLKGWSPAVADRAELTLLRDEALPVGTAVTFAIDGQARVSQPLWPSDTHRGGFGSIYGVGGFGLDAATGPGLGRGALGLGPLGADQSPLTFVTEFLPAGEHTLTATSPDAQPVEQPFSLDPLPTPVTNLRLTAEHTLAWEI